VNDANEKGSDGPDRKPKSPQSDRESRLAAALRANLRRRKSAALSKPKE
jgi:hypothetical protein